MKTYLWIIATAVSKIKRIRITGKIGYIMIGEECGIEVKRWMRRCPLIIFAERRIDKVIGRIIFLTVSITTINEVSMRGAPIGTRWVIILLKELIHPFSIKVSQIGKAIIIDRTICLEGVKI